MKSDESRRLTELVVRLDCITDDDLALLAAVKVETVGAWRHRGEGPEYVKVGNRALYSVRAVQVWLGTRVHGGAQALSAQA